MKLGKAIWSCISDCGACCRLSPEERTEALEVLNQSQLKQYMKMVGKDGWCRYLDKTTKKCTIYEKRPDFCHAKNISSLFTSKGTSTNELLIKSCKQHIRYVYGGKSVKLKKYQKSIKSGSN